MPITHLLQDFGKYHGSGPDPVLTDATLEEHQLEAFEQGYQAGWEDSAKAHAEDHTRVSNELTEALQQMSFTFVEAQTQVLQSLRPLFQQIAETVLPQLGDVSLPLLVSEQLSTLAAEHLGETLVVAVSEADRPSIEAVAKDFGGGTIQIKTKPALVRGQVEISNKTQERSIDLHQVIAELTDAIEAFGNETERTSRHG